MNQSSLMLSAIIATSVGVAALAASAGDKFLDAAKKYANDRDGIMDLYIDHANARSDKYRKPSELEEILEDMVQYSKENQDASAPKHVLTVLTDDMGWADIGYNDEKFVTPFIDTVAKFGVKFKNFYVQSTCSPTRASMLTGLDATKTGLQDGAIIPGEPRFLPYEFATTGDYLGAAGYSTYFIGKWHIGARYMNQTAPERGYDYFFGILGGGVGYYDKKIGLRCGSEENGFNDVFADNCKFLNGYDLQEDGVPYIDTENYITDLFNEKAIDKINAHDKTKPMLMHYHTNAPHTPLQAPAKLLPACADVGPGAPDALQPYFRQVLCAMVTTVDIDMLRLYFALGLNGMLPNTLLLFHSDNGGLTLAGSVNDPYRSMKGAVFEGGVHVPAFMYGNGLHLSSAMKPERDDFVFVSDVTPTLLGYAGVDAATISTVQQQRASRAGAAAGGGTGGAGAGASNGNTQSAKGVSFDGYNLWPAISLNQPLPRQSVALNAASKQLNYFSAFIETIFGTTWKYAYNPGVLVMFMKSAFRVPYEPEGEVLFNLTDDPYETKNLATGKFDMSTLFVLNYLRLRTWLVHWTSAPSQITAIPVLINTPPSTNGCWLPIDSPLYATADCPADPVPIPRPPNQARQPPTDTQTSEEL